MPDEYISRAEALTALQDSDLFNTTERQLRAIRELPAADVAPVVHGRWVLHHTATGNPYTECSNCCTDFKFRTDKGTLAKLDMRGMLYCPNCGARILTWRAD